MSALPVSDKLPTGRPLILDGLIILCAPRLRKICVCISMHAVCVDTCQGVCGGERTTSVSSSVAVSLDFGTGFPTDLEFAESAGLVNPVSTSPELGLQLGTATLSIFICILGVEFRCLHLQGTSKSSPLPRK